MGSDFPLTMESRALLGLAEGRRLRAGLIILAAALTAGLVSLLLVAAGGSAGPALTLYIAGIALLSAAAPVLFPLSEDTGTEPLTMPVIIAGILILALAVSMRVYHLASLPFGTWYDEALAGLRAQQFLLDPGFQTVFGALDDLALYFAPAVALSFKFFGASTQSVRLVSVAFGLGSVILSFFLGRAIYGSRFGLLLAFFFAVARWPITFDRLGMGTSTGPFFVLLVLLLLLRGRDTRSPRYFAWAGLAVGVSLGMHGSLRLFLLAVLFFLAFWTAEHLRGLRGDGRFRVVWGLNVAFLVVGFALAAFPLLDTAVHRPQDILGRVRQVSIFERRDEPDLGRAIASNTVKNALMFNYSGDRNGRHNLPGEPMLDPITGALFVLGLALALFRFRRPPEMLFLLVLVLGLASAVLTVDFEAPQAQRGVGAMAAVFFFCALAAEAYWRVLDRARSPEWIRHLGTGLLVVAGVLIVYLNSQTYFVRQANDNAVWQSHSAIETITARMINTFDETGMPVYVSMFLKDNPVITFLAPGHETKLIMPPDVVPLREEGDQPVAVMLELEQASIVDEIEQMYPGAQTTIAPNLHGDPLQYTVIVPAEEIRRVQGLSAAYWPGSMPQGAPELSRIENEIDVDWPDEGPLDEPFTAAWEGVLYAPTYGSYELRLQAPGPARLWLDDDQLVDIEESGEWSPTQTLAQGNHALHIEASSGEGRLLLAWRPPGTSEMETVPSWALYHAPEVSAHGLLGAFYNGENWGEVPALERIDPIIDAYFHLIPLPRPYTVHWTGEIEIPEDGSYVFGLRVNGQAQLTIDGQLIVDAAQPAEMLEGAVELDAGRHDLSLKFLDKVNRSRLHLYWTPPGQPRQIVPAEVLYPG